MKPFLIQEVNNARYIEDEHIGRIVWNKEEIAENIISLLNDNKEIIKMRINMKNIKESFDINSINLITLSNLKKYELKLVLWDVIIGDWKANITSDEIANKLLKESKDKSIIYLHDGRGENDAPLRTIQALEKILPIWLKQGYKFVKVEELYE